jgi:hypothetical protein
MTKSTRQYGKGKKWCKGLERMPIVVANCTVALDIYPFPTCVINNYSTSQAKSAASRHIYTESMLAFEPSLLYSPIQDR